MRKVQRIPRAHAALRIGYRHAWACNGVVVGSHCSGLGVKGVKSHVRSDKDLDVLMKKNMQVSGPV